MRVQALPVTLGAGAIPTRAHAPVGTAIRQLALIAEADVVVEIKTVNALEGQRFLKCVFPKSRFVLRHGVAYPSVRPSEAREEQMTAFRISVLAECGSAIVIPLLEVMRQFVRVKDFDVGTPFATNRALRLDEKHQ